jgi:hypothetical protein
MLPQGHRKKHLLPRGNRPVHPRPESQKEPGEDRRIVGGEAQGVEPVGRSRRQVGGLRLDRAADDTVDGVTDPGGTVVAVVVVVIEPVLGPLVPAEELPQLEPGGRRQVELLQPHRPVVPLVSPQVGLGRKPGHPVPHLPADEAEQEVLLAEVEQPVVVRRIGRGRVLNPDGVVSEPLPHQLTGAHRHEIDPQLGARLGLLHGPLHDRGRQQQGAREQRRGDAVPHSTTSLPSWAER